MMQSPVPKSPGRGSITGGAAGTGSAPSTPSSPPLVMPPHPPVAPAGPLDEAMSVLEAIGGESHLDGFNLLGVIANPRGSMSMTPSSYHGRYGAASPASGAQHAAAAAANHQGGAGAESDIISDTYHTLEMTLSQVTEQMEALNSVLEDWSRQILEDDPYGAHNEDQPPESLLEELPPELQNLDLSSLQSYLEASGVKAHKFRQRQQLRLQEEAHLQQPRSIVPADDDESDAAANDSTAVVEEIPPRFFQSDFDLTEPETFREFLLLREEDEDDEGEQAVAQQQNNKGKNAASSSTGVTRTPVVSKTVSGSGIVVNTEGPVHEWFPLPPQDTFGSFLDKVELALLLQVRSKSGAFFEESLRFAQLQETIQSLLAQVITMQNVTRQLQHDLLEPMETIPEADSQRAELQELLSVLDIADELLQCRSSIGGLLASQDDLTTISQIQYGRSLLSGKVALPQTDGEKEAAPAAESSGIELRRLQALKSVWDQLNQYEMLVVTNLREELVEIFLGWNSSAVSSIYATGSASSATSNKCPPQVQQRVLEIVGALRQCRALPETRDAYGNRLQEVIRMTVRTTVGEFASDAASDGGAVVAVSTGATAMALDRFLDCVDMLFEQLLSLLSAVSGVDEFCVEENLSFHEGNQGGNDTSTTTQSQDASIPSSGPTKQPGPMKSVITDAAELSSKSISDLLRLRKEAHSLVTLIEMKRIWDKCMSFAAQVEDLTGHTASALRSTLLAQVKSFVERKHESNMSSLVAALESERWTQCEVSVERQAAMTRLCSGLIATSPSVLNATDDPNAGAQKNPEVVVEGRAYKVVWSCLLLVEMIISDMAAASHFPSLASSVVAKISELLRLFNSRTTQLVLGAGAIHSTARLKSINAKHLSLVTQCLGLITALMPHIRAGLMLQLPPKQHTLLASLDQIKKEYADHNEKVLNKFVTIIGGIVEHGLAPKIKGTDFDARAQALSTDADEKVACCIFLEGVSTNTRKMHQVLASLLPPDHLQDVFSRIFAFLDKTIPALLVAAAETRSSNNVPKSPGAKIPAGFSFPQTDEGKRRLLLEVSATTENLNGLAGVHPWDFTATSVLGRQLEFQLAPAGPPVAAEENSNGGDLASSSAANDVVTSAASDDVEADGADDAVVASPEKETELGAATTETVDSAVDVKSDNETPTEGGVDGSGPAEKSPTDGDRSVDDLSNGVQKNAVAADENNNSDQQEEQQQQSVCSGDGEEESDSPAAADRHEDGDAATANGQPSDSATAVSSA